MPRYEISCYAIVEAEDEEHAVAMVEAMADNVTSSGGIELMVEEGAASLADDGDEG